MADSNIKSQNWRKLFTYVTVSGYLWYVWTCEVNTSVITRHLGWLRSDLFLQSNVYAYPALKKLNLWFWLWWLLNVINIQDAPWFSSETLALCKYLTGYIVLKTRMFDVVQACYKLPVDWTCWSTVCVSVPMTVSTIPASTSTWPSSSRGSTSTWLSSPSRCTCSTWSRTRHSASQWVAWRRSSPSSVILHRHRRLDCPTSSRHDGRALCSSSMPPTEYWHSPAVWTTKRSVTVTVQTHASAYRSLCRGATYKMRNWWLT